MFTSDDILFFFTNLNLFCIRRLVSVFNVLLYDLLKTLDFVCNVQITDVNHLRLLHKLQSKFLSTHNEVV